MDETRLAKAFARITALRENLPQTGSVHEKYVREFHEILGVLAEALGQDFNTFLVRSGELQQRVTSVRRASLRRPAHVHHSRDRFCERGVFLMKIDGLLAFFKMQQLPEKARIGFQP